MNKKEYDWLGDWQGPKHGKYVIRQDDQEMEPSEVIAILDDYQDLIEQLNRLAREQTRDLKELGLL